MGKLDTQLQEKVREIFDQGDISVVIGWGNGWSPVKSSPLFVRDAEAASGLLFNEFCFNNLAVYLPRMGEKTAIITKPCEQGSIIALLAEGKVNREDILVISIGCDGIIEPSKLEREIGKIDDISAASVEGEDLVITAKGEERRIPLSKITMDKCAGCEQDMSFSDIVIGDSGRKVQVEQASLVPENADAAWWRAFWVKEFDRCLRCYACREACPACYCRDNCAVQSLRERWTGATINPEEALMFHAQRAMHVAGRCTECGACERACPVNIPLTLLHKQVGEAVRKLFNFKVGEKENERPPLETFSKEEL